MTRGKKITLAHSPDSDDAFMFYGLAEGKVDTRGWSFQHVLEDIQTLNLRAQEGYYDVTAISYHAYPFVRHHYVLTTCGSSVGDGYGPVLVSKRSLTREELEEATIGVAGTLTTSYLALKLFCPNVRTKSMPFDQIMEQVTKGNVDAGLLIHEGQVTYRDSKLHKIVDLGEWWGNETGLPLPLGGNAIKKSIAPADRKVIAQVLRESIEYGLKNREAALAHSMKYARDLDVKKADTFVGMYVNDFTVDLGKRGRAGLALLLQLGYEARILKERVIPEFAD